MTNTIASTVISTASSIDLNNNNNNNNKKSVIF